VNIDRVAMHRLNTPNRRQGSTWKPERESGEKSLTRRGRNSEKKGNARRNDHRRATKAMGRVLNDRESDGSTLRIRSSGIRSNFDGDAIQIRDEPNVFPAETTS